MAEETPRPRWAYPRAVEVDLADGVAVVFADLHAWPGDPPGLAFAALLRVCRDLAPRLVVANGDVIDGARISRHPRIGWARVPHLAAELGEVQRRLRQVRDVAPRARRARTIGNHDARFDSYLSARADEMETVPGGRLADHLPDWPEAWTVRINRGGRGDLVVKHRVRGGIHAVWNNVRESSGPSICTAHLHRCEARAVRGYGETRRWGIEVGTLATHPADVDAAGAGPFEYVEDNPVQWAEGFGVLTWRRGLLLPPEFCSVEDGRAWFRGQCVASRNTRRG